MTPQQVQMQSLDRARAAIRALAQQHDEAQEELRRTGKIAIYFPVLGTLPSRRKPGAPKPKRGPRPSK